MNYSKIYTQIIERAKGRQLDGYKESHHIIPECKGGGDDPNNLVDLTPEEHYVCHQLLVKMFPGDSSLVYAAMMMTAKGKCKRSNKVYGWLRRKSAEAKHKSTTIFDHKKNTFLFFNSRKDACDYMGVSDGDCSSLIKGKIKSLKKGRFTRTEKQEKLYLSNGIRVFDTHTNCYTRRFNTYKEASEELMCNSGDLIMLMKGQVNSVKKRRYIKAAPFS